MLLARNRLAYLLVILFILFNGDAEYQNDYKRDLF